MKDRKIAGSFVNWKKLERRANRIGWLVLGFNTGVFDLTYLGCCSVKIERKAR